jgi:hypothetical protein
MLYIGISPLGDIMPVENYAIVDDINNSAGINHASVVEGTIEHYLELYGDTGNVSASAQFPQPSGGNMGVCYTTATASAATVENNSWGSPGTMALGTLQTSYPSDNTNLENAFLANKTLVFAAGNWGSGNSNNIDVECSSSWTINVSAADDIGSGSLGNLTYYSYANPGLTNYVMSGQAVNSTMVGTSFAAPRLSALALILQAQHNNQLTQSEIHTLLDTYSDGVNLTQDAQGGGSVAAAGNFVWHRIDDATFGRIVNASASYVPGTVNTTTQAEGLYALELDRVGDSGGVAWLAGVIASQGIAQAAADLKGSAEYQTVSQHQFNNVTLFEKVQALYHDGLGRESDDGGMAYWLNRVVSDHLPNFNQISSTGQFIDLHQYYAAFFGAAGVAQPTWLS